ncbi:aldo/keto reductase [Labedaea rhizosphaerae]|uniref:Aryl-alcohol dehydrogenase-like predicted oxidoreductase n=1 Tax=Labedaea rhizosphaerae TaxID=598644 RepID=A0A4R6SKP1_LABRH|nr:aldo/keto reductase [Labedaea rhizosphaerae]TDQ04434.1 aryl-alcohol dehydrogenase-like predicted oxidoreductase [Labedaea rhizosphaerae]
MDYVRLGGTGLVVSRLCLGMMSFGDGSRRAWHLGAEAAAPIVRRAVERGITFFDTADMYSGGVGEQLTGKLLSSVFGNREDYVLATKVYYPTSSSPNGKGLSRKHIMAAIDASLRRLGTDYVDLYQIHRWDPDTPIEETMTALDDLVRAGKVRYLGASTMYAWQFAKAQHVAPTPFVSMQNHYNLLYREEEREMIPYCADQGIGVLPYSPLARGLLARADTATARAQGDPVAREYTVDEAVLAAVRAVAERRETSTARVALAWLLGNPAVTAPVVGATKVSHVDEAVAALDLRLTDAENDALTTPYRPQAPL